MINKLNLQEGDVITIKFLNSDEVVARLSEPYTEGLSQKLIIVNPMSVMMSQQGFGLIPFIMTLEENKEISLSLSHIITILETEENIKNAYLEKVTGLKLVKF